MQTGLIMNANWVDYECNLGYYWSIETTTQSF